MAHVFAIYAVVSALSVAPGVSIQVTGVESAESNWMLQAVRHEGRSHDADLAIGEQTMGMRGPHGGHAVDAAHGHHGRESNDGDPSYGSVTRHDEAYHTQVTDTSDAVSVMLLAMTTFFLSLFYMVNFPCKAVQGFTWSMMSSTISIFGAIFIWTAIKTLAIYSFTGSDKDLEYRSGAIFLQWGSFGHGGPSLTIGSMVSVFCILYIAFNSIISRLWAYHVALEGFATIGAHTLGFAAAEIMGTVCSSRPWNTTWILCLCFAFLCGAVIFFMNMCTTWVRNRILSRWASEGAEKVEEDDDAAMTENEKELRTHWVHVCQHAENEWAAFAGGLLVTLSVQFMITGELPNYHGNPYGQTMTETSFMFMGACTLAVLLVFAIAGAERVKQISDSEQLHRAADAFAELVSFSFGWCFLFACRFLYWSGTDDRGLFNGDTMTARVVQAIALTLFTFVLILLLKGLADQQILTGKSATVLMASFGLMLGLSWEGAFYQAIDNLSHHAMTNPTVHVLMSTSFGLFVSAVVLPAWAFFVLPTAMAAVEAIEVVH